MTDEDIELFHIKLNGIEEQIREIELGRPMGLYEIAQWWIDTYPEDIFVNGPKPIVIARDCMKAILELRDKDK